MAMKRAKAKKVPVSRVALMARVNRALAKQDRQLRASRGARAKQDLGEFFVVGLANNTADWVNVDPVDLARELGVLKEWEKAEGL